MTELLIPVSIGEAVDKYNILQIKQSEITDRDRLADIQKESSVIAPFVDEVIDKYSYHYQCLNYINRKIWDLSDRIRDSSIPYADKVDLYAETFVWNDSRYRIKSKFNKILSSNLKEQKSYAKSSTTVGKLNTIQEYEMYSIHIRYLSLHYDVVYVRCPDSLRKEVEMLFQGDPHIILIDVDDESGSEDLKIDQYTIPTDFYSLSPDGNSSTLNYVVGGKLGDFIHLLYVVMGKWLATGKKGCVYITDDGKYGGDRFSTNAKRVYDEIYDVVSKQPYISSFSVLLPGEIIGFDVNLNDFRQDRRIWSMGWMNFLSQIFRSPPALIPWISLTPDDRYRDIIFIHRSQVGTRHNMSFTPLLVKIIENNSCRFITCNPIEYEIFPFKDKVPLEKFDTIAEMYSAINSCKFFIGNQSSPLVIAYSLGKPCLCESTEFRFYADDHRPFNAFYWISNENHKIEGIENFGVNYL